MRLPGYVWYDVDDDIWYAVSNISGCYIQGRTITEAIYNLIECASGLVDEYGDDIPDRDLFDSAADSKGLWLPLTIVLPLSSGDQFFIL